MSKSGYLYPTILLRSMQDDDFTQLHIVSSILIENDLGVFPIPLKLSQLQPVLACAICEREGSTSTSPPRP
jgi:hypothetical protein